MKTSLVVLALLLTSCANLPPVKAKVCYETPQGSICAGTDGKAVVIDGNFKGDATLTFKK